MYACTPCIRYTLSSILPSSTDLLNRIELRAEAFCLCRMLCLIWVVEPAGLIDDWQASSRKPHGRARKTRLRLRSKVSPHPFLLDVDNLMISAKYKFSNFILRRDSPGTAKNFVLEKLWMWLITRTFSLYELFVSVSGVYFFIDILHWQAVAAGSPRTSKTLCVINSNAMEIGRQVAIICHPVCVVTGTCTGSGTALVLFWFWILTDWQNNFTNNIALGLLLILCQLTYHVRETFVFNLMSNKSWICLSLWLLLSFLAKSRAKWH